MHHSSQVIKVILFGRPIKWECQKERKKTASTYPTLTRTLSFLSIPTDKLTLVNSNFYFCARSQLLRHTRLFTFSDDKDALFFWTMWPARENNRSQGTDVEGVPKYFLAWGASRLCECPCLDHHSNGQESELMVGSALYRWTQLSIVSSSFSESDSDESASRVNLFVGGSGSSTGCSAPAPSSLSNLVSEAHTSFLSPLGTHLRSLKRGSNAVAIFRYAMLAFPLRVSRSFLNVALNCVT